jgi:hypothetical protein
VSVLVLSPLAVAVTDVGLKLTPTPAGAGAENASDKFAFNDELLPLKLTVTV